MGLLHQSDNLAIPKAEIEYCEKHYIFERIFSKTMLQTFDLTVFWWIDNVSDKLLTCLGKVITFIRLVYVNRKCDGMSSMFPHSIVVGLFFVYQILTWF